MNSTCDTDCNVKLPVASSVDMKQNVGREVSHANAVCDTQGNVKHTPVCESDQANVNHICESLPNVKPVCSNDGSDHALNQSMYDSLDAYQVLPGPR